MVDSGGYRIRVGIHRIVYDVNDKDRQVIIYRVRHRKDVHR
jgi:mRNA-degrading endonuclease RelE of RelBE toxin-antitoxin system